MVNKVDDKPASLLVAPIRHRDVERMLDLLCSCWHWWYSPGGASVDRCGRLQLWDRRCCSMSRCRYIRYMSTFVGTSRFDIGLQTVPKIGVRRNGNSRRNGILMVIPWDRNGSSFLGYQWEWEENWNWRQGNETGNNSWGMKANGNNKSDSRTPRTSSIAPQTPQHGGIKMPPPAIWKKKTKNKPQK